MKIEALETIRSHGFSLESGDRISVPDDVARIWIGAGWASDPTGAIPTGERKVVKATVQPHDSTINNATTEA